MKEIKHYLFHGYNIEGVRWCRANTIVLVLTICIFIGLFGLVEKM